MSTIFCTWEYVFWRPAVVAASAAGWLAGPHAGDARSRVVRRREALKRQVEVVLDVGPLGRGVDVFADQSDVDADLGELGLDDVGGLLSALGALARVDKRQAAAEPLSVLHREAGLAPGDERQGCI